MDFIPGWEIEWLLPPGTPNGFVIQKIESKFDIRECNGRVLDEQEIWLRLGFSDQPRFKFYEAWEFKDGYWPSKATDIWGWFPRQGFAEVKTFGKCVQEGSADFYKGDLMDFGGGWGVKGQNSGSPISCNLMSTIEDLSLPYPLADYRKMEFSWNSCGTPDQNITKIKCHP